MGILNVDNLRAVGSGTSVTCLSNRLETTNINASGIVTATGFVGPFENTGDFTIDDWIVHAGDTNTKFGFPDADTFTIETNGAERLRIKSDGSVGIGTATPTAEFDVYGNSTVAQFRGTGGSCFIGLTDVDAGAGVGYIGSDNGALVFQTPGSGYSTKLNIASDGKISAGTLQTTHTLGITGGSSSQLLVKGTEADIWMESTGPSGVWRILGSTGTNTHRFRIYDNTNGKEPFYIIGSSGSNTQHVHVNSGNLVFDAAGTGISFVNAADTATGETTTSSVLDEYEEGTWVPTFLYVTVAQYGHRSGKYVRCGNMVHVVGQITIDNGLDTSDGSAVTIGTLPYVGSSNHEAAVFTLGRYTNLLNSTAQTTNGNNMRFTGNACLLQSSSNGNITYSQCNSTGTLQFACQYMI